MYIQEFIKKSDVAIRALVDQGKPDSSVNSSKSFGTTTTIITITTQRAIMITAAGYIRAAFIFQVMLDTFSI
jgi:hypothetical protein